MSSVIANANEVPETVSVCTLWNEGYILCPQRSILLLRQRVSVCLFIHFGLNALTVASQAGSGLGELVVSWPEGANVSCSGNVTWPEVTEVVLLGAGQVNVSSVTLQVSRDPFPTVLAQSRDALKELPPS